MTGTSATTPGGLTVDDLRVRLRRAAAEIGGAGRFSVTFYQQDGGGCSIMYWAPPDDDSAVERCEEVGHGTLAECLAALDRFVRDRGTAPAP